MSVLTITGEMQLGQPALILRSNQFRVSFFLILARSCVCKNDSKRRICWDMFVIVLVLWNVLIVPLNISFESEVSLSDFSSIPCRFRSLMRSQT